MYQSQFIEMFDLNSDNSKWPIKHLPDLSTNLDSKRVPITSGSRNKGQYPYYGASGIVDYVNDYIFDQPILLISEDGANLTARVTPIAFSSTGKVWVNNHAHVVAFDDILVQEFVEYFLNLIDLTPYITGTAQPKLNQDKLNKIPIPCPDHALVNQFCEIKYQADKSKFGGFKSQFIEMFGSLATTPVGQFIQDTYPGEWGVDDSDGAGIKVIRTTNFTNTGKLDLSNVVTRNIEDKKINKKRIQKFDTILERSGGTADNPVGRVVLFEEDGEYLCNNFTQILRFKDTDPRFAFYSLYYFYQTNKTVIRSMGSKTTGIQNLNMSKYLEIGIPNASEDEQKQFVSIAEQADKSKSVCRQTIKRLAS